MHFLNAINENIRKQQEDILRIGDSIQREKREAVEREERRNELLERIANNQVKRMPKQRAIEILEEFIEETKKLYDKGRDSAEFIKWEKGIEVALSRIFDDYQQKIEDLKSISFSPDHIVDTMWGDGRREIMQAYNKGIGLTVAMVESFVDEISRYWEDDLLKQDLVNETDKVFSKVFVSHYSGDREIVRCVVDLLEALGLKQDQIFCSSFPPYGIPFGEDPLDYIKKEFENDVLALFVLTKNFFERPICMCEMGAAWVRASKSIPIIIPPLDYEEVKGVVKEKQGFRILEEDSWIMFHDMLVKTFGLQPINFSIWKRKWDDFSNKITKTLNFNHGLQINYNYSEHSYFIKGLVTNIENTNRTNTHGKQIYIFTLNDEKRINIHSSIDISKVIPGKTVIEATPYKTSDNVDYEKYVKIIE